jgi:A/G-specific adenine glycosylase
MQFNKKLGEWYDKEKRILPWRDEKDPYRLWISEIILQQTRISQGLPYYINFISKFPDIFVLARADPNEVLKAWQGLGYYSRALNMLEAARDIVSRLNGHFPDNYQDLLKLKGIGEYTAAAISSLAYNEPRAVVDGNVKRVISRIFAVEKEINSGEGKKIIQKLADQILDTRDPGRHNQAMLDLGAMICLPKNPRCIKCPVKVYCRAFSENKISELPVKYRKQAVPERFFNYLVIIQGEAIWLRQRLNKDIWKGLFEFPMIETSGLVRESDFPSLISEYLNLNSTGFSIDKVSEPISHKLSHKTLICRFLHCSVRNVSDAEATGSILVPLKIVNTYPVPKPLERYLEYILGGNKEDS